ncbi:MAG: acyltransferase, partial [Kitasatospora sp.]|nr:acyltransferase [Kitasatospora sp.]
SPYQHFWSLGIEEQFYLAAPIVLVVTAWTSRALFRNRFLVGLFLVAVIGGSLYLSITQTGSNQPLAYFGTQARIWELAFGILLALGAKQLSRMNQVFAALVSWAGLALALGTAVMITESTPLPGYAVGGPVLGAGMIIAGGCAAPRLGVERLIANPVFNSVANVSYGWYLWHWPLLILWPNITGHDMTYSDRFRVASLSLVLAYGSFYVVERRFRTNAELVARPWKGILTGITALAATAAATAVAMTVLPLNIATSTAVAGSGSTGYSNAGSVSSAALQKQLSATTLAALPKAPDDHTHYGCIDDTEVSTFVMRDNCVIGDTKGKHTVVVIGDSHSWQWGDAFNQIGQKLGARFVTMAKGGCSPEAYAIKNPQLNREYTECDKWRDSAFEQIKGLKPDLVIVTSRIRQETTEAGAEKTFKTLEETGSKLLYLTDTPQPGQNIPDCLATRTKDVSSCNPGRDKAIEFRDFRALEQRVAERHGAKVLDVLPAFCTDKVCPTVISDQIVYFDSSHITAGYAISVVPFLEPSIKGMLGS